METGFRKKEWNPSLNEHPLIKDNAELPLSFHNLNTKEFKDIISTLRKLTNELHASPYAPDLWTNRGLVLARLGYPELVAGDNYKAILLIREAQKAISFRPDTSSEIRVKVIRNLGVKIKLWKNAQLRQPRLSL